MTSFDTLASSRDDGRPIELFEIVQGATTYRLTSAEDDITIGSDVYTADSIVRDRIEVGSDNRNRNLLVTMRTAHPFPQQYISTPPGLKATINIYRYQRDEVPAFNTQVLMFKGQVKSVQFPNDGYNAAVVCAPIESALNRNIPRFTFMGMCNHVLYDNNCGVNSASFNHIGAVSAVSGTTVTVTGLNASGLDVVGGYCTPTSGTQDFRMILSQSGDDIEVLLPFANDPTGLNLQCFAGCDHVLTSDCALVFDNVERFGGFAFVPSRNIFQTGLD